MAEKVTVTVRPSIGHADILTVQDAMRQVLDIFDLLEAGKEASVKWQLIHATTNSPFQLQGEAVSFDPAVDISVVARAQKIAVAAGLREIARGNFPDAWSGTRRPVLAKRLFNRNLNGVGATLMDFEIGDPIAITPTIAKNAVRVLERKPEDNLYELPSGRQEIGSLEGTLSELSTHWNHPAIRVIDMRTKVGVWCRLGAELKEKFANKATFTDIWEHKRVVVRGLLRFEEDGSLGYILATDIEKIEPQTVAVDAIRDRGFSGGLSTVEYLDRFRDGALG